MIKAVIFDLDNTLLDFVTMKREAVKNALSSMIEVGLDIDSKTSYKRIMQLYEENGWERNQYVFNKFLREVDGRLNHKYLAAGIVAYRRAKDKHLKLYPNVEKTLNEIKNKGIKLAIVSDAPNREAWMRIFYLKFHSGRPVSVLQKPLCLKVLLSTLRNSYMLLLVQKNADLFFQVLFLFRPN